MGIVRRIIDFILPQAEAEDEEAYSSLASIIRNDLAEAHEGQPGYPNDPSLPRGTYSEIARRRGCTTSYVSSIAKGEGFRVRRSA